MPNAHGPDYPLAIRVLPYSLTVCRAASLAHINLEAEFFFIGRTYEEISLVCSTDDTPPGALLREDGWHAIRVEGVLDFSLVGILAGITTVLADAGISLFAVSTYNTDYILIKDQCLLRAIQAIENAGYRVFE